MITRETTFRESDHPGIVFPGNVLSGENDHSGNDFPGNVFPGKKPSGKVTIRETTVYRYRYIYNGFALKTDKAALSMGAVLSAISATLSISNDRDDLRNSLCSAAVLD